MNRTPLSAALRRRPLMAVEHLEDRSVPAALTHVNEDWNLLSDVDLSSTLTQGDIVNSANDAGAVLTATYGVDAFGTVTTSSASGATITTPTSLAAFDTITEAVAATTAGGTVRVLEGTYNEFVPVGQSVTLLGAQAGVDARTRLVAAARETIINGVTGGGGGTFAVTADNVTIDGFTIRGDASINVGINTGGGVEGLRALNNVIENVPVGIAISGAGNLIQGNLIRNLATTGAQAGSGVITPFDVVTATTIDSNTILSAFNSSINISPATTGTFTGVVISNNRLQGTIFLISNDGTSITGNTITTVGLPAGSAFHGIQLFQDNTGIDIINNTITVAANDGWSGIRIGGGTGNSDITIDYNVINTGAGDFGIRISAGAYTGTLPVNFNSITDATDAINTDDPAVLIDASANYWGTSNPATVQGRITGAGAATVDFTPLLNLDESAANKAVVGFQPNLSSLTVHTLGAQTPPTGRIREGINLVAPGGTVAVAAGTDVETVNTTGLTKPLRISPNSGGVVNVVGGLTLNTSITLLADVNGTTAGTSFDQVNVTGSVALNGATLVIRSGVSLPNGTSVTLINNDLADAVSGTFAGLPQGAIVTATNGQQYTISYIGGDGNDVVLTAVSPPTPAQSTRLFAVGADAGANGHVKVFNANGSPRFSFFAFPGFNGGVRVATGDVNGDQVDDIVVGAGPGAAGGHVKVFDGATGALISSFLSFSGYSGGVNVAVGDIDGDGDGDLVVGASLLSSHVKVFDFASGATISSFLAFPGFNSGVTVAAANYNGVGGDDIIVGTATSNTHVKVFDIGLNLLASFFANPGSTSGVNVAAGGIRNNDGLAEILVAPATGTGNVRIFAGGSGASLGSFNANPDASFGPGPNGLRVAVGDANNDNVLDILVGPGPNSNAIVKAFNATSLVQFATFSVFPGFSGGVFVG